MGKTLDFMSINAEFVGYKFSGTLDYRPNTAEADVNRATVTITRMSATTTPVLNARNDIVETLCFKSAMPATVKIGEPFDLSVLQNDATTDYTMVSITGDENIEEDATTSLTKTDIAKASISKAGLYAITVKDTEDTYASWTTTVYVE
jgi:hypothetical protein